MADYLNLSPFHFVRQFKKSVGITPYQYVMQQRVEMAKVLLKQKKSAIADVAFDCGFQDGLNNSDRGGKIFLQLWYGEGISVRDLDRKIYSFDKIRTRHRTVSPYLQREANRRRR